MTDPLTPERIAELRALERAASQEKWLTHYDGAIYAEYARGEACLFSEGQMGYRPNAAFVAVLRNAAPALLDAAEALLAAQARIAELQRDRALLSDTLNGTPCAEIRWQQEREDLREALKPFARIGELIERGGFTNLSEYGEHFLRAARLLNQGGGE